MLRAATVGIVFGSVNREYCLFAFCASCSGGALCLASECLQRRVVYNLAVIIEQWDNVINYDFSCFEIYCDFHKCFNLVNVYLFD